jgi:hypothetical protein
MDPGFSPALARKMRAAQLDAWESFLLASYLKEQPCHGKLLEAAKRISFSAQLRLLVLSLKRETDPSWRRELRTKIFFLLHSLDPDSKNLLLGKWRHELQEGEEILLRLSPLEHTVRYSGKKLDWRRQKQRSRALLILCGKRKISLPDFVQKLWDSPYNESYYHRARMLIQRINAELGALTGVPKAIECGKAEIRVADSVRIEKAGC